MTTVIRMLILFVILTLVSNVLLHSCDVTFGTTNYWDKHGFWFLVFITLFPRLTLLFSSVPTGGFFWWLGWLFAPRFLVALLATVAYWQTNKLLVILAWLVCLGGESGEKVVVQQRVYRRRSYD